MDECEQARGAIGERIARARLASGFETVAGFARAVGVAPNTVYRWERGSLVPDIFRLETIARVTRVSTDWLLRGSEINAVPALLAWRATPQGQLASEAAMRFLESLPLGGYMPTLAFYDLALFAFERHLSPEDAVLGARATEAKRAR